MKMEKQPKEGWKVLMFSILESFFTHPADFFISNLHLSNTDKEKSSLISRPLTRKQTGSKYMLH